MTSKVPFRDAEGTTRVSNELAQLREDILARALQITEIRRALVTWTKQKGQQTSQ